MNAIVCLLWVFCVYITCTNYIYNNNLYSNEGKKIIKLNKINIREKKMKKKAKEIKVF